MLLYRLLFLKIHQFKHKSLWKLVFIGLQRKNDGLKINSYGEMVKEKPIYLSYTSCNFFLLTPKEHMSKKTCLSLATTKKI